MSFNQPPNGPGRQPTNPSAPPGWQQQPQNAPGAPGGWQSNPYDQPLGGNPYGTTYSKSSNAVLALILSVVGTLCCCTFMAPVGLYLGKSELDSIDRGDADPSQRGMAQAAFVLGIIGTAILVLGSLYWIGSSALGF